MPEAYIYDHVRTPRGRGKAEGALHEVTAVALATVPLKALKERNNLKQDIVDDVFRQIVAFLQRFQRRRRQRQHGHFMQRAIGLAAAARRTNVIVDIGLRHDALLI